MNICEQVFKEIDEAFEDQIQFLKNIVRCKSTLFNELSMQQEMARKLKQLGLTVDIFDADIHKLSEQPDFSPVEWGYHNRPQVVGIWKSEKSGKGKSLVLNGHADVVPVEDESLWTYDPWAGTVADGKLYGRGAGDMKCGLAAIVYAVAALRKLGVQLEGDVIVQSVIEEEASGNGTLSCIERGYVGDAAFIAESIGPKMLMAQTGSLWLRTTVYGSPGHAEGLTPSINAIEKAYKVIAAIKELEAEWNEEENHPAYKGMNHVLNFSIGEIKGGSWPSSVPSKCEFTTRFNLYPDINPADMEKKIIQWLKEKLSDDPWLKEHMPEFMWFGHRNEGYADDPEKPFYRAIAKAHEEYHKKPVEIHLAQACSDTRFFIKRGIPSACYGPLGPNAHGNDEHVVLSTMKDATKVIASVILNWCNRVEN